VVTEDQIELIGIGRPCLWRDHGPGMPRFDENAIWFGVSNLPGDWEADLLWVTGERWAFFVRCGGINYLSKRIYLSKESALEWLKKWLRENAP
jgi:hypothetical protein